ncbi:hypothetical protein Bcav_0094 [Beutenbergia cavernae DSM 12333]|uniref:Uncharacterized protein n=1 Tax=Beutenbergia cavernae (strain ATCC BAA-8 / DSM 12333 / CCUG 43141 / JCM 11478 / NBRC 16432 / NCIMB 13614 / HKI 0122) TaxID=471853 RepID=C5BUY5_BEUC1|nr:hypothetical protein [Beutenbergia cavernae]ACQ78359.1 hypothetical protein Bcav_0094 [Beutenbergia cavernae DSM 12333]
MQPRTRRVVAWLVVLALAAPAILGAIAASRYYDVRLPVLGVALVVLLVIYLRSRRRDDGRRREPADPWG